MAELDSMLMSIEEYTLNANKVKELVIGQLLKDEVINEEQAQLYATSWNVIIVKSNWFERWMNKFGKKKDNWSFKFVKFQD